MTRWAFMSVAAAVFVWTVSCSLPQMESGESASTPALAGTPIGPLPGTPESQEQEPQNPFDGDRVAIGAGQKLFMSFNCAGCHGDHGGGGMGPSLRDETWLYGSSPAHIASSIAEGRAHGMPAWGRQITTEQAWKLAAYIKSMRTNLESNPPSGN